MPLEVQIQNLAYGGDAMGHLPDGRAVFVPFCLPGERVLVEIVEEKRNFVRARLVKVLQASPERIEPRCPHFTECGGCHYQHLPYEAQLAAKSAILQEQLQRIAGIASPPETYLSVPRSVELPQQFTISPAAAAGVLRQPVPTG